jgi:hypothetical protein
VDLLILDIEGAELEVLETLPWDKVDITAITVETEFVGVFEDKKLAIQELLESQGMLRFIVKDCCSFRLWHLWKRIR